MALGEAGSITRGGYAVGEEIRINFQNPIENAIIVTTATNRGGNEFSIRIIDQDDSGFTFVLEEWEDEDGPHPATETINWLAVKQGVHTLPDGRVVEAGQASADTGTTNVALSGGFTDPPVVLTNVASDNEADVVDSDPFNVTASGFDLSLEEGSVVDGSHVAETVNFIAIQPGTGADSGAASIQGGLDSGNTTFGLGASFADAVILGETQTLNEPGAGNVVIRGETSSTVQLNFDEESGNGETAHGDEDVGIVAFEDGIIPCFTPSTLIATPQGTRPVEALRPGDLVLTRDAGLRPVLWSSATTLPATRLARDPHLAPILIPTGALGPNLPDRDMMVSPQHRMLMTGWKAQLLTGSSEVLVPAKALTGMGGIRQLTDARSVRYLHLLFDSHQVICANGTWSESLHAGELDKSELDAPARAELFEIFPHLASFTRDFGPLARPGLSVREGQSFAA